MIKFETARINTWHIGAIFIGIVSNAVAVAVIWTNLARDVNDLKARIDLTDADRTKRAVSVDASITTLNNAIQPLSTFVFRLGQLETRTVESDKRLDRVVETLGAKIDAIGEGVNTLRTDVKALTVKIDLSNGESRTRFNVRPRP